MVSPHRAVVQLRGGSDGDASHIPKPGTHIQLDPPTLYLEKIGQQWLEARGEAQRGVKYILAGLPVGYTLWHRPRPKDPKHYDKYLYGHPSHKVFDSPNRFYPHFEYLMKNGGSNIGCPCTVCNGNTGVLPKTSPSSVKARSLSSASSSASSRASTAQEPATQPFEYAAETRRACFVPTAPASSPVPRSTSAAPRTMPSMQHKGRPKSLGTGLDTTSVDEEGTPDVYRNLINKLRRHDKLDEEITEPMSMDWRAEQETLPELLRKVKETPQWVPRVGDIVLYVRELPEDVHVIRHPIAGDYRMYDENTKLWLDHPVWEAGLVGQTPAESVTVEDICENGDKESNVTYFGVRVEPLPHVNSTDKSLSKRHKYIPIRHIRPFVLWKQLLSKVPKRHPTVLNAQAITSTLSLTGRYRFRGTWPEAYIYCRGLYIGHEMLAVGDAVRLLPNANHGQTVCTDILVIKSIRLKWSNLDKASDNDWDEGRPYSSSVWIYGTAYTNDSTRMNKEWLSNDHVRLPEVTDDYGEWYPLHPPSKELAIPYSRILGRLYERDAMALWLNSKSNDLPLLDAGRDGLVESRTFARQNDNRIARELDATWYWGDSRAQALDLHTMNGLDVASQDQLRDPKEWRKKIKIMDGIVNNKFMPTTKPARGPGAAGRNLRAFMAPALSDLPVRSQGSIATDRVSTNDSVASSSTTGECPAVGISKKRLHVVSLSSDDDEEDDEINREIRETTKFVEEVPKAQAKKARVAVVID